MHKLLVLLALALLPACATTPLPPTENDRAGTALRVTMSNTARNWIIIVYDKSMTFQAAYSWADSEVTVDGLGSITPTVANIQDLTWHVTRNEDSLEATWLGDSNGSILNISPHDRVIIATLGYRTGETPTTYYQRFRGFASLPANQNHTDGDEHQYRALGISRLLETTDTGDNHQIAEGQDLASGVADDIVTNADTLPAGITYSTFASIGVTNTGKINPGSADLAQNLAALVSLAGVGGVDAATGVKPTGELFFEKLNVTTLQVQEGATGTEVAWSEPQADEVITAIRWVLLDGNANKSNVSDAVAVPLDTPDTATYLSDSGITTYGKRTIAMSPPSDVEVIYPLAVDDISVATGTLYKSFTGTTEDSTADVTRASDGRPENYIVVTPDVDTVTLNYPTFPINGVGTDKLIMITARFRLDPDSDDDLGDGSYRAYTRIRATSPSLLNVWHMYVGHVKTSGGGSSLHAAYEFPTEVDSVLAFGDRSRTNTDYVTQNPSLTIVLNPTATGLVPRVAISDWRLWAIDTDALDALAEQEYRFPEGDAFEATIQGESPPAGLANITKLDGTTLSGLSVEALGTRISGGGVETLVTVGPRTPAHVSEELNRIKRRDRLAALAGARAGRRR